MKGIKNGLIEKDNIDTEDNMKEEDIKNIVTEGYRNILKREPDSEGLANYINEIKKGLSIEMFHNILKSSNEYKERFNLVRSPPL